MTNQTPAEIIRENVRLRAANEAARANLAVAYGIDEAPTPTFQAQRRDAEARTGSHLTKFFAPTTGAIIAMLPPICILVLTERRLLLLPEPLLAQVQACEKAYSAGRWYVSVPAALWQSLTRLLA